MVVLRATRKVLRTLPSITANDTASDTALGDWYVNRVVVDRQPLLLLVSSLSLLAIIAPARKVRDLPKRLPRVVVDRLLRLGIVRASPGEIVNLATGELTSVRGFSETAARLLQIPNDLLRFGSVSVPEEEKEWNVEHATVSVERLRDLTGWVAPTTISEGIRETQAFENADEPHRGSD